MAEKEAGGGWVAGVGRRAMSGDGRSAGQAAGGQAAAINGQCLMSEIETFRFYARWRFSWLRHCLVKHAAVTLL